MARKVRRPASRTCRLTAPPRGARAARTDRRRDCSSSPRSWRRRTKKAFRHVRIRARLRWPATVTRTRVCAGRACRPPGPPSPTRPGCPRCASWSGAAPARARRVRRASAAPWRTMDPSAEAWAGESPRGIPAHAAMQPVDGDAQPPGQLLGVRRLRCDHRRARRALLGGGWQRVHGRHSS